MRVPLQKLSIFLVLLVPAVFTVTSCNKSDADNSIPFTTVVVTNTVISNLTTTTARSGGFISDFVANTITQYGVCWSATNKTPTTSDTKTTLTTANVLHFISDITGLTANTPYYLRAYALNTSGVTTYGDVVQFTTPTATFSIAATANTYAGSTTAGYVDLALTTSRFNSPQGIAIDAQGNLYIADSFNNAIRKITSLGVVSTLAGNANAGYKDAAGAAAQFYSPQGVAVDAQGNVYVSDVGNNAIRKITPAGVVTTLAGGSGAGYADGTGTAAKFSNPAGLAVDAQGSVYVADRSNNVIRKITAAGVVTTLSGQKVAGYTDGANIYAQFNNPTGLAIDSQGILYVADISNNAIRKVAVADGTATTLVGNPLYNPEALNLPVAVNADSKGDIFIVDESGRVMEITAAKVLYSIAGNINVAGYANGSGTNAAFNNPQGITTDAAGNIYVTDYNNNVIRKLTVTTTP